MYKTDKQLKKFCENLKKKEKNFGTIKMILMIIWKPADV